MNHVDILCGKRPPLFELRKKVKDFENLLTKSYIIWFDILGFTNLFLSDFRHPAYIDFLFKKLLASTYQDLRSVYGEKNFQELINKGLLQVHLLSLSDTYVIVIPTFEEKSEIAQLNFSFCVEKLLLEQVFLLVNHIALAIESDEDWRIFRKEINFLYPVLIRGVITKGTAGFYQESTKLLKGNTIFGPSIKYAAEKEKHIKAPLLHIDPNVTPDLGEDLNKFIVEVEDKKGKCIKALSFIDYAFDNLSTDGELLEDLKTSIETGLCCAESENISGLI